MTEKRQANWNEPSIFAKQSNVSGTIVPKTSEFDKKVKEKNYIKKKGSLKGTFLEKNLTNFLFFSFYQGFIIMERPFWLIKILSRTFKNARKNKKYLSKR